MQKCLFDKRVKSPTVQCQLHFEYIHRDPPFLSIFSTRFRRDLLFYCFVPDRSISTVTASLQTLVKCKKCSDKYDANHFENDYNNLSRHVASFSKKVVLEIAKKAKKEKIILVIFNKKICPQWKKVI